MFAILACVLNLGNIAFDNDGNEGAVIRHAHGSLRVVAVSVTFNISWSLLLNMEYCKLC